MRLIVGPHRTEELTEFRGNCLTCGVFRVLLRQRYGGQFHSATYMYPDGYLHTPGGTWARTDVWAELNRRYPAPKSVEVREAPARR